MKYFAILEDRNGFTKEIQIEKPELRLFIPIINPGTNRVFENVNDYVKNYRPPSISQKTFLRDGDDLVSKDGKKCWVSYKEL